MSVDAAFIALRAASFVAAFQAAGLALFSALFDERLGASRRAIGRLGFLSALAGLLLVLLVHAFEAPRMTGDFADLWDYGLQRQVLHSSTAAANGARIVALLAIAVAVARAGAAWRLLGVAGALALAAAFTLTGHTATHSPRWALAALLSVHLVIVAFWFGALPALVIGSRRESVAVTSGLIAAFSRLAGRCVPLIAAAGIGMALLMLPGLGALWTPYGILLLVKIGAFTMLMMLAALNKWRLGPGVATGEAWALSAFRRSVAAEYLLIVGVLAVTAVLTSLYSPEP